MDGCAELRREAEATEARLDEARAELARVEVDKDGGRGRVLADAPAAR